jgi:hypothetical protein
MATAAPTTTTPTTQPGVTTSAPRRCAEHVTFTKLKKKKPKSLTVKAKDANIRKLPGLGCPILTTLHAGDPLRSTGRRARSDKAIWLEVKGSFGRGWVYIALVH